MKHALAATIITSGTLLWPRLVSATEFPAEGGRGGSVDYRAVCDEGSYVVGLDARAGAAVDRLQVICAHWNGKGFDSGRALPITAGDSNGGEPRKIVCPEGAAVVRTSFWFNLDDRRRSSFLDGIDLLCAPLIGNITVDRMLYEPSLDSRGGGYSAPNGLIGVYTNDCPPNEVMIGMHGRSGLFIDSIGWICGRNPAVGPSQLGRATPIQRRFGATGATEAADARSGAGIHAARQAGSTSMAAAAPNQTRSVVGGLPMGHVAPPMRFEPPLFADGARLWACQDGGDTVCDGRSAAVAWCMSKDFRGAVDTSPPRAFQHGTTPVKNYLGEACRATTCQVVETITCSPR